MYFINPFYGWVLSSQNGLQNFMYYYASRLDTYGPTMGVWRPMRNKSVNITVICQDPIVNKNSTRNKNVNDTVGDMMTKDKVNGADVQFLVSSSPAMDNRKIFNRNMFTIICVLSLLL